MHICQATTKAQQSGITLIEVLVLVIIMSIGLLGIAGLQVVGMKLSAQSGSQTQAMLLAEDLIARIHANRDAIVDLNGNVFDTNYKKAKGTAFPATGEAACLTSTGCTPEEMATTDLVNWSQLISNSLPANADTLKDNTFLCLDSDPTDATDCDNKGSSFVLQIGWSETSSLDTSTTIQTYRTFFEP